VRQEMLDPQNQGNCLEKVKAGLVKSSEILKKNE